MPFPYERYNTLDTPVKLYYPAGQQAFALQVSQHIDSASTLLARLLSLPTPAMEILIAAPEDWDEVPFDVEEDKEDETGNSVIILPYLTHSTEPPTLVIPTQLDPIIGDDTVKKRAFLMFHELAHLVLENDPRPWSLDHPLWADEWQMQFAALWLAHQVFHIHGIVQTDLHTQYADIFVPEADGKTPVTVRGFDWYEDTSVQDYLEYTLLLERFAADLLASYDASILPRYLVFFREEQALLSDDVTDILAAVLGDGGKEWLENLDYF